MIFKVPSIPNRSMIRDSKWVTPKKFSVSSLALKEPGGQIEDIYRHMSTLPVWYFEVAATIAVSNSISLHKLERITSCLRCILKRHTWISNLIFILMAQISYNLQLTSTCLLQLLYCDINLRQASAPARWWLSPLACCLYLLSLLLWINYSPVAQPEIKLSILACKLKWMEKQMLTNYFILKWNLCTVILFLPLVM